MNNDMFFSYYNLNLDFRLQKSKGLLLLPLIFQVVDFMQRIIIIYELQDETN